MQANLTPGYIAVPKHYVRRNTITGFDIYLYVGRSYVLYHAADAPYDEFADRRLRESAPECFYIRSDAAAVLRDYMKDHLESTLVDDTPPHAKAEILFTAASDAFQRVVENPEDLAIIESASDVAILAMEHIAKEPRILSSFVAHGQSGWQAYAHAVSCCFLGSALGVRAGLSRDELVSLSIAALLHDVGFSLLDPELSRRPPEMLSQVEWTMHRRHPVLSAEIMARGALPDGALLIARQHHERLNGSGYPAGLRDGEITPGARIVAIVDTYDRLVNPPPGQPRLGTFNALSRMRHRMPGCFDIDLLMGFVQLLGSVEISDGTRSLNGWAS